MPFDPESLLDDCARASRAVKLGQQWRANFERRIGGWQDDTIHNMLITFHDRIKKDLISLHVPELGFDEGWIPGLHDGLLNAICLVKSTSQELDRAISRGTGAFELFPLLEQAFGTFKEEVETHCHLERKGGQRILFDADEQTVKLDGKSHIIRNPRMLKAYRRIVEANGEIVKGKELGKWVRPGRELREQLPSTLSITIESRTGRGGGFYLGPAYCCEKSTKGHKTVP